MSNKPEGAINLRGAKGPANGAKSDSDIATWMPSNRAFGCTYDSEVVQVTATYGVWMTQAEHTPRGRKSWPAAQPPGLRRHGLQKKDSAQAARFQTRPHTPGHELTRLTSPKAEGLLLAFADVYDLLGQPGGRSSK